MTVMVMMSKISYLLMSLSMKFMINYQISHLNEIYVLEVKNTKEIQLI